MKRISTRLLMLAALLSLMLTSACSLQSNQAPLFNGKNLDNWDILKCKASVTEDGNILIEEGNGLIQTQQQYANFILEFDWKALAEDKWDSGVYFRYTSVPEGRPWPGKHQVNLRKGQEGDVSSVKGAKSTGMLKDHEWNNFKLIVIDDRIELFINGQPAWKAEGMKAPAKGFIALQAEVPLGGKHLFKNVYITELPSAE